MPTRFGNYSTPEKNPPCPLECSPALRPGNKDSEVKEDKAISAAADYATSLTFNDEQHANKNNVVAGGNIDNGGSNCGMNNNDGGNDPGMNDDKGEQQVEEERGGAWERVTKKRKSQISDDELHTYFDSQLRGMGKCPNQGCNCFAILANRDVRDSIGGYFCWFNAKMKYEQDSIVFKCFKYLSYLKKSISKLNLFCLQFINDGMAVVPEAVCTHVVCSWGLLLVLNWGFKRW